MHLAPASHGLRVTRAFAIVALSVAVLLTLCAPSVEGGAASALMTVQETDSARVAAVVQRYHRALETGDSAAALALLADDAIVLESGGVESRDEYRSHHLPADMAFAQAVKTTRSAIRVTVRGDAAWASSTSSASGEFRGRPVSSRGAELMVLVRTPAGWRIAAIHWSSRRGGGAQGSG